MPVAVSQASSVLTVVWRLPAGRQIHVTMAELVQVCRTEATAVTVHLVIPETGVLIQSMLVTPIPAGMELHVSES